VDDQKAVSVVAGPASNGGTCTYLSAGVLRVQRDATNIPAGAKVSDVSGCVAIPEIKTTEVTDVAVEAEFAVTKGCGGLWVRTSNRGYFLAICKDVIRLHQLGDTPPGDNNLLKEFTPKFDPAKVVVGLLVQGPVFTLYVDGQPLRPVSNDAIAKGHVGVGGFPPGDELDVTLSQYRAWAP
jgi:hypothetical protein